MLLATLVTIPDVTAQFRRAAARDLIECTLLLPVERAAMTIEKRPAVAAEHIPHGGTRWSGGYRQPRGIQRWAMIVDAIT